MTATESEVAHGVAPGHRRAKGVPVAAYSGATWSAVWAGGNSKSRPEAGGNAGAATAIIPRPSCNNSTVFLERQMKIKKRPNSHGMVMRRQRSGGR